MCPTVVKTIKKPPLPPAGGQCVLPKKELLEIVQWYKGELTSNALLNRAGHLAAKRKRLLADPSLDAA